MKRILVPALSLAVAMTACLDLTPTSERDLVTVLVPELLRPGMELALATFRDLETQRRYRPVYDNCTENARRAVEGEGALLITLHPAWGDYVRDRVPVLERATIGVDRLVLAGSGSGPGAVTLADPNGLTTIGARLGVPSTESEAVGIYTREALIRYGLWSRLQTGLRVYPSAAASLAALASGGVDAVFAAESAALEAGAPILLRFDEAFHQPMLVEVVLLDDDDPQARALFDYLVNPLGRGAFLSRGLQAPR